jgi:hypothetical protein
MTEPITSNELRSVLIRTLETLAPVNGTRVIPAKVYADCLLDLLVNANLKPPDPDDVDALCAMFRAKLERMIEAKDRRYSAVLQ